MDIHSSELILRYPCIEMQMQKYIKKATKKNQLKKYIK